MSISKWNKADLAILTKKAVQIDTHYCENCSVIATPQQYCDQCQDDICNWLWHQYAEEEARELAYLAAHRDENYRIEQGWY